MISNLFELTKKIHYTYRLAHLCHFFVFNSKNLSENKKKDK